MPALRSLRQEDCKFKGNLGYTVYIVSSRLAYLKQELGLRPTNRLIELYYISNTKVGSSGGLKASDVS